MAGGKGLGLAAVVFVAGAGLGFGWRQGWVPVEFLPPNTGVLDETATEREPNAVMPLIPVSPVAMAQAESAPSNAAAPFPTDSAATNAVAVLDPSAAYHRHVEPAGFKEPPREATATPTQAAPPVNATPSDFDAVVAQAEQLLSDGETLAGHKLLSKLYWSHRTRRPEIQDRLDETARQVFFDPQPHFIEPYVIQPGDRLDLIAADYHVSWEYLSALNRTDPRRIQAGRRLKVVKGPFAAVVELDDFMLTVHLAGYYVRRYPVGIGRDGSSPVGKLKVLNKVVNPSYTDPDGKVIDGDDPQNPLGERWIDLGNSYGIHGTIEPESIGRAASRGCIRMRDDDVISVYNFLVNGSEVAIRK